MAERGGEAATAFDSPRGVSQVRPGAGAGGARGTPRNRVARRVAFRTTGDKGACGRGGAAQSGGKNQRQRVVQCAAREVSERVGGSARR